MVQWDLRLNFLVKMIRLVLTTLNLFVRKTALLFFGIGAERKKRENGHLVVSLIQTLKTGESDFMSRISF